MILDKIFAIDESTAWIVELLLLVLVFPLGGTIFGKIFDLADFINEKKNTKVIINKDNKKIKTSPMKKLLLYLGLAQVKEK